MKRANTRRLLAWLAVLLALAFLASDFTFSKVEAATLPAFVEVTDATGLFHRNETWGWAWGDYDGDGYLDLFLGNHPEQGSIPSDPPLPSYLMRNERNGTFRDAIGGSGILLHEDRHDQSWIDFDDDGDLDLWVSIGGRGGSGVQVPKQLYRQDSPGQFTDVAIPAGVDYPLGRGRGSAWLDYDLDGDLDLYFAGAIQSEASNAFFRNNGDGTFTNIASQLNLDPYLGEVPNIGVADYDNDGDPDMYVTDRSRLYRNDRAQFVAVQGSAGVTTMAGNVAAWADYDNDGDLDLFVSRGRTQDGDRLDVSVGELRFVGRSEGDEDGLDITVSGAGNLTLHLQQRSGGSVTRQPEIIFLGPDSRHPAGNPFTLNYGEVSAPPAYTPRTSNGFFIWQSAPGRYHVRWTAPSATLVRFSGVITTDTSFAGVSEVLWEPEQTFSHPNSLFQNQGNGTFREVAGTAGVAEPLDSRGAAWGDFDNDGFQDLFVQTIGTMGTSPPNPLYHNDGDGTFSEVAGQVGVAGSREGAGWGALWADYDNDGFLDLLTSQATWPWPMETGSYELFRNQGNSNHWLKVELRGVQSNSLGIGARVWATTGGMTQLREVHDSSHYFNHYNGPLHFGLGQASRVVELRVVWPSGVVDVLQDLAADRLVMVREGGAPPEPTPTPVPQTPTATPVPVEIIVDNLDAGFSTVGFWNTNSSAQFPSFNGNFRYATSGTGSRQATFTPAVASPGDYEVFVWYLTNATFGTIVPYTIDFNGGTTTVRINHRGAAGGGFWQSLGVYNFAGAPGEGITVSNDADGTAPADAVRLMPVGAPPPPSPSPAATSSATAVISPSPTATSSATAAISPSPTATSSITPSPSPTVTSSATAVISPSPTATTPPGPIEVIVDNLDAGFATSGFWKTNTSSRYPSFAGSFRYIEAGTGNRTATFTPDLPVAGDYEVFIWHFTTDGSATNVPHTIHFNGGSTTVFVDRRGAVGGGSWFSLGIYNFAAGASGSVTISNDADGIAVADAVRFLKP